MVKQGGEGITELDASRRESSLPILGIGDIYPVTTGGQKAIYDLYSALHELVPCCYVFLDPSSDTTDNGTYPSGLQYMRIGGRAARSLRNAIVTPKFIYRDGPVRNLLRTAKTPSIVRQFVDRLTGAPSCVFTSPWLWSVLEPHIGERQVIYDSQNFELRLAHDRLAAGTIDRNSLEVLRVAEAGISRRADLLLACSAIDASFYERELGVDSARIRTGFKGASVPKRLPPACQPDIPRAIFVGSDWPANNEAARLIIGDIAPKLPTMQFRIVGQCCRNLPTSLPSNVEAAGFVEDLEQELLSSSVALNPIFSGSGINMKLLEYLALGMPIISSEFGARGVEAEAMGAIELATMDTFAQVIGTLVQAPERMLDMRHAGYDYAKRRLDWHLIANEFAGLLPVRAKMPLAD